MTNKRIIKWFRITYITLILLLVASIIYFRLLVRVPRVTTRIDSSNQSLALPRYSPSPSPYILPIEVSQNKNLDKNIFKNSNIYFEFPSKWKVYTTDSSKSDPLASLIFKQEDISCINYVGTFYIAHTDSNLPSSYKIAQKNEYGTSYQISRITTINNLTVGLVTQPVGDGSGGYEPGITIDFLSNSKKFHYFFFAKTGCRKSYDDTYILDILPILKTIRLLD